MVGRETGWWVAVVERVRQTSRERERDPLSEGGGLTLLIWREALSSEEPVGGASGTGMIDVGVIVAGFSFHL